MANRMISYGYGIENGAITVIPSEAEIVKEIFNAYLSGKILKEIAIDLSERGIVFFEGRSNWNKNTVVRIIQNKKYIGEKNYPIIIDANTFEKANSQKEAKGHKKEKQSEFVEYLKGIVYCGSCGKALHRRVAWGTREKWHCENGCKCEKYIDDKSIFGGILKVLYYIKDNPQLLFLETEKPTYTKTQEIMRYTNEIGRYMNEKTPSFNAGKKLIMECASLKFAACSYNGKNAVGEYITVGVCKRANSNRAYKMPLYTTTKHYMQVHHINGVYDCPNNMSNAEIAIMLKESIDMICANDLKGLYCDRDSFNKLNNHIDYKALISDIK